MLIPSITNFLFVSFNILATVMTVRALPWPARWLARKPLGCHVCLSGWLGIVGLGWNAWDFEGVDAVMVAFWGGATGVSIVLDALVSWLKPLPPPAT